MRHHGGSTLSPDVLATGEIASRVHDETRQADRLERRAAQMNPNDPAGPVTARQLARAQDRARAFAEALGLLIGRCPADIVAEARERVLSGG